MNKGVGGPGLIFREVEDRDLILRARRGAVDAFNLLVSRWEKRVYNYVLRLVRDREDALDLTQDTFMKAYQNLSRLQDPSRFAPWLYRIAHNQAYSWLRKPRPAVDERPEADVADTVSSVFPIELGLAVESALARLSEDQREAVVLKIYQGFKFEEMAEVLGCPVSTVKSRLYSALDVLKEVLAPVRREV